MPIRDSAHIIAATRAWIEHAVIGLNLCPFAKPVFVKDLIRYAVSPAHTEDEVLRDLRIELEHLAGSPPEELETTLLILPQTFVDFFEFNDFLDTADELVAALDLTGVLQIASFHPRYQFAGCAAADVTNATNRSPYPTLHLLREESIERVLQNFPAPDSIYRNNLMTLTKLGTDGWNQLQAQYTDDAG